MTVPRRMLSVLVAMLSPTVGGSAVADSKPDAGGLIPCRVIVYPPHDLRPDRSFLVERLPEARRQLAIKRVLLDDVPPYARCQLVIEPSDWSREHELLVYLDRRDGSAEIVTRRARRSVDELAAEGEKAEKTEESARRAWKSQIEVNRANVSADIADVLEQVWEIALNRVREPPDASLTFHPTFYRFSHWDTEHTYRSGWTMGHDPDNLPSPGAAASNVTGQLNEVAWAMIRYARSNDTSRAKARIALETQARALLERFLYLGEKAPQVKERRARLEQQQFSPPIKQDAHEQSPSRAHERKSQRNSGGAF